MKIAHSIAFLFCSLSLVACGPAQGTRTITINAGFQVQENVPINLSEAFLGHGMKTAEPLIGSECLQNQLYLVLWDATHQQVVSTKPINLISSTTGLTLPTYDNNTVASGQKSINDAIALMKSHSRITSPLTLVVPQSSNQLEVAIVGQFFNPVDANGDGICDDYVSGSANYSSSLYGRSLLTANNTLNLNVDVIHANPVNNNYNLPGSPTSGPTISQDQARQFIQLDNNSYIESSIFNLASVSYLNDLIHVPLPASGAFSLFYVPDMVIAGGMALTFVDQYNSTILYRAAIHGPNRKCVGTSCTYIFDSLPEATLVNPQVNQTFGLSGGAVLRNISPNVVFTSGTLTLTGLPSAAANTCTYTLDGFSGALGGSYANTTFYADISISSPRIDGVFYITTDNSGSVSATMLGYITGTCPKILPFSPHFTGITASGLPGLTIESIDITGSDSPGHCFGDAIISGNATASPGPQTVSITNSIPGTVTVNVSSANKASNGTWSGNCPTQAPPFSVTSYHN